MSNDKKVITYVCTNLSEEQKCDICFQLVKDLPVIFKSVKSIQELFPLFSQPSFNTDYIVLDVDDLNSIEGIDAFDILRSLSTIINCTVYRDKSESIKPIKRNTKIVAMVSETTSPILLKEILSMSEFNFLTLRLGEKVDYSLVRKCVENYLNNGDRAPKFILDIIKQIKPEVKKSSSEIKLTARQHQILDIISTRGASNKHISKMLNISESTVKLHVGAILKKYGVKNRTQLAVFAKKKKVATEAYN